jgi:tetratricopeptide (TPR) repeat protein
MSLRRTLAVAAAALALFPAAIGAQHHYVCGAPPPLTEPNVPLWKGVSGTVTFDRVSASDSAQKYFEQGLALIYGFNHLESVLSFRKAARFDSGCAMCYWGVAIALGPNINEAIDSTRWKMAAAHADSAWMRRETPYSRRYQGYLRAGLTRYRPMPTFPVSPETFKRLRGQRDTAYAATMDSVWRASGRADLTAGAMYTEALMDLHPWDLWNESGTPKWWSTTEALNVLRTVLGQDSTHVGAAHLWIHMLEGSHRPDLALPQADMLERLMPGAAHITHMPSHIYHRTGQYARGVGHNERATAEDARYLGVRGWMWRYPMYFAHDHDFLWVSATFAGMRDRATTSADSLRAIFGASGDEGAQLIKCYPNAQHFVSAPILVATRFGDWSRADTISRPDPRYRYPTGVWHFGRGWARLRKGDVAAAQRHRDSVDAYANVLADSTISNNSAGKLLRIAGLTLSGEILAAQRRYPEAIATLESAVRMQDSLNYDEPPPFFYPARHSLGAVLVESGSRDNASRAIEVYLTDLGERDGDDYSVKRNPDNAWAYVGMANAVRYLGIDPSTWLTRARSAWRGGELPPSSRY